MRNLLLLSSPQQAAQDQRLLNLAAWMGVSTRTVAIESGGADKQHILSELQPGPCCLGMSAETLAVLRKAFTSATELRHYFDEFCAELLVFGCRGSTEQNTALSWLTDGAVCGIGHTDGPDTIFALPREAGTFSRQLAGLSFSRRNTEPVPVFELRSGTSAPRVIVDANRRPIFVRMDRGRCQVFLLAGPDLHDLDEPLSSDHGMEEHYDRLIPVLIFLRHCFRESCWHGPEPTARIIIDDPPLKERYGFLDCGELVKSMQRSNYGTSIAFIPWNHWRTSRQSAARFLNESSRLSICIQGCDHTNKEFASHAPELLSRKAGLAMQRMESQRERTGAEFERVMVFPQGLFSRAALPALRANNYLAAVNTTCFPTDGGLDDLKVRDFLRTAVIRYNGFPIFQRRPTQRLFDLAFNLFLGKPALVVEHHDYFRDGIGKLEEFVAALYRMEPDLTWPTLTSQLTRSCQMRSLANGATEVQFFTRRFQLTHCTETAGRYLLSKYEPDSAAIGTVLADGKSVPFYFDKDFLKLELQAESGQARNIEILDRQNPMEHVGGLRVFHNARVLVRRGLSEFRDMTLSRHNGLLKAANKVAKVMGVTGDS